MNLQQTLKELKALLDTKEVVDFIAAGVPCPNINKPTDITGTTESMLCVLSEQWQQTLMQIP